MDTALYLLPVTLGDTELNTVLPAYNIEIIQGTQHFIVEDVRSAHRFLKKVDREFDIDSLSFYPLNKYTSAEDISGYLEPLLADYPLYKKFYYDYQCRSMSPERIVPDCFFFYLFSKYPLPANSKRTLLHTLLHFGKLS